MCHQMPLLVYSVYNVSLAWPPVVWWVPNIAIVSCRSWHWSTTWEWQSQKRRRPQPKSYWNCPQNCETTMSCLKVEQSIEAIQGAMRFAVYSLPCCINRSRIDSTRARPTAPRRPPHVMTSQSERVWSQTQNIIRNYVWFLKIPMIVRLGAKNYQEFNQAHVL